MSLRLDFTASDRPEAQEACARLKARYGAAANPDVVVALGGDGWVIDRVDELRLIQASRVAARLSGGWRRVIAFQNWP